jgi:four helix bundle protein
LAEKKIKTFEDLETWQVAHELILVIYKITKRYPKDELYGIVSQLRRAALSITANIAEGFSRYHYNDKIRFYHIARGSVSEVRNCLRLSKDLAYIAKEEYKDLSDGMEKVSMMINGLIRSIEVQK